MDKKTPEEIKGLDNYIKCNCVDCLIHGDWLAKSTIKGDHSKYMMFDIDKESLNEN